MSSSWIHPDRPALIVAPMEGVTDAPMRALLAERGGFTHCVSEFLRVSQEVPPARTFFEHVPELRHGCRTPSGMPVQVQLLGGDPERLARTAKLACDLGAEAIDLNFGCPAPTVNRNDGGATLLKFPVRIRSIVEAVRAAVPKEFPVSAKLRLGWDSIDSIDENAEMAAQGGAAWITIHGRTRLQGYTPPAYWGPIGRVRDRLGIPVVANGEIWSLDDFKRCRDQTGSIHFMLGRGVLGDPDLPLQVANELGILANPQSHQHQLGSEYRFRNPRSWIEVLDRFVVLSAPYTDGSQYTLQRVKQWLRYASMHHTIPWWDTVKRMQTLEEVVEFLSALRDLNNRGSVASQVSHGFSEELVDVSRIGGAATDPVLVSHNG